MHGVIVLGGGLAALICCLLLGHAWISGMRGLVTGARFFIPPCLPGAFVNMYLGVQHGYAWGEAFPIVLARFAVPTVVAGLIGWRLTLKRLAITPLSQALLAHQGLQTGLQVGLLMAFVALQLGRTFLWAVQNDRITKRRNVRRRVVPSVITMHGSFKHPHAVAGRERTGVA